MMRVVSHIILLLTAVQFVQCRKTHGQQQEYSKLRDFNYFHDQSCLQDEPDCEKCLSNNDKCEWCSDGSQRTECIRQGSEGCPRGHRKSTCKPQKAEEKRKEILLDNYDKSLDELAAMDTPAANISDGIVTVNASVLCARQSSCDNCTLNKFCLWCESKQECQVYYNATTTKNSCHGTRKAYHNQCLYPIGVTHCPKRKSTCKHCLSGDGLCYWCSSTEACEFYPGGDFEPKDCASDKWYYEKCPVVEHLLWVLFPILAIIMIPVILYLIIWLICCCMRAAGYEPLEPAKPSEKKHPKGIRLKPGSPTNKTDELRKKYDLNNP